jgi:Domain of unknown function (DU1801)
MKDLDDFFLKNDEAINSCLMALKDIILKFDPEISFSWKYGMPFFSFRNKMFCYLWTNKKNKNQPYLGLVEGKYFDEPYLLQEKRSRMKIMLFNQNEDLPIEKIHLILQKATSLYKNGVIAIPKK